MSRVVMNVMGLITTSLLLLSSLPVQGKEVGCVNANIIGRALVTDMCWDCVFPIRVSGVKISGSKASDRIPDGASNRPLCTCKDAHGVHTPGVMVSLWQPFRLVEFQRVSGCSSVLNGIRFPTNRLFQGNDGHAASLDDDHKTFRHYHYYTFPIMIMLDMYVPAHCNPGGYHDLDLMYMSELDPTWNNDELAFFTNPEASLVASPMAAVACIPDAVSSNLGKPLTNLFWCAGSWGVVYPFSGNTFSTEGILRSTSLMAVKTLSALHRRGLEYNTIGNDNACGGSISQYMPKNQYRFTLMHPRPETKSSHAVGESTLKWGLNRTIPSVGEDPIYVVWRWIDCCSTK